MNKCEVATEAKIKTDTVLEIVLPPTHLYCGGECAFWKYTIMQSLNFSFQALMHAFCDILSTTINNV